MTEESPSESGRSDAGERRVLRVLVAGAFGGVVVVLLLVLLRAKDIEPTGEITGDALAPAPVTPSRSSASKPFPASFTDVARDSGVIHSQSSGAAGERLLPETMGSGVAIGDLDGDGDPDLLFADYGGTPRLYRNDTAPGGSLRFTDVTDGSGLEEVTGTTTTALGDFDGDGLLDALLGRVGGDPLFRNTGEMTFVQTEVLGGGWTTSAGFFDADGDLDADILVANYVDWTPDLDRQVDFTLDGLGRAYGPPTGFPATDLRLLINDGSGSFVDEAGSRGLKIRRSDRDVPVMKALGLLLIDVDRDGDADILVANDTTPNRLFLNDGDGVFTEEAARLGVAFDLDGNSTGAMGIDAVRDPLSGELIVAVGNFANESSSLYRQRGGIGFRDESALSGIGFATRNPLTFGTLLLDLDLDGLPDLIQINGHIEPEIMRVQKGQQYRQRAQIFRGDDKAGRFLNVDPSDLGDLAQPLVGRAAASGDLDGDGDHDLVITGLDDVPRVLRNDLDPDPEDVLVVEIRGLGAVAGGEGVRLDVHDAHGAVVWTGALTRTRSYLAQSQPVLLLGIKGRPRPLEVRATFPTGDVVTRTTDGTDRLIIKRDSTTTP